MGAYSILDTHGVFLRMAKKLSFASIPIDHYYECRLVHDFVKNHMCRYLE